MKQWMKWAVVAGVVLSLCGCSSKRGQTAGEGSRGVGDVTRFYGEHVTLEQEAELLEQDTFYFAYDSFEVDPADALPIYAHAKKIIENPSAVVRIEGHTDQRGSREYNVALGERRAKAVANMLMMKGVDRGQINVVSYGKEKPEAFGNDESAWKQNRRAIIVYESE